MLRILHLSDIQYGRHHVDKDARAPLYPDDNYSRQLGRLIDDLDILKDKVKVVPNFIAVTGDVAEWSKREEYEAAGDFLGGLADYLKIDRRYVILVPGNHDVNRKLCQAARLTADAEGTPFNRPYFPKFKFYGRFFEDFYKNVAFPGQVASYRFTEDRLFVNFYFPEEGVVFMGLNSCVDESELDPHYGNITVDQLKRAIGELNAKDPDKKLIRIALMHHNFVRSSDNDAENLKDADDLKPLLMANNIQLILHGHQHIPRAEVTGKGNRVIHVLATGSAGLDGETLPETPRRYQIIEIDNRTVRVYRRFFDNTHKGPSGKGCWKPDMAPDQPTWFDSFIITGLPGKKPDNLGLEADKTCDIPPVLVIPEAYRQWVFDWCGHMDVDRLQEKGSPITVSLPEVFIELATIPPGKSEDDVVDDPETLMKTREGTRDVEDMIAEGNDLIIKGEAGSGKTTLLKHFVYMCFKQPDFKGMREILPVLIFLKDMKGFSWKDAPQNEETAAAILQHCFRMSGCGLDIKTVKNFCSAGKAVFLLDGLDEIESEPRDLLVNALTSYRRVCRGGRFVFSGRPHGVQGAVFNLFSQSIVPILPLSMGQVEKFVLKWFQSVERSKSVKVTKTAEAMVSEIKDSPGVERLIYNPLMLTAVCILYHDQKELPGQRAELYKKFVENMLHRGKRFKDPELVHEFLMSLAYRNHTARQKGIDKTHTLEILKTIYPSAGQNDIAYNSFIEKTLERIEPHCGLLKTDAGQLSFRHLTFQEFLTAEYIKDRKTKYDDAIKDYWQEEWYKEVVELLVGLLSIDSRQWANDLVEVGLTFNDALPFYRWRLAARSIIDIHEDRRDTQVVALATERMRAIIVSEAEPNVRADAGEILGWLGDRRNLEAFIKISDGEYDTSAGQVTLAGFEMARYPVTNQWYKKFVDAGGYEKKPFWTREGWKWLQHTQARHPWLWHDRRWNCPNHPVVGVCWWEADAFCRWLEANRNDGYAYRLPTEQEWEATAAGSGNREYPWGKGFDENKCNTNESGIDKTSAVGTFPNGETPEKVADLSGNVWEWTRTDYNSQNSQVDFPFDEEVEDFYNQEKYGEAWDLYRKKHPIIPTLRGGSWGNNRFSARCGLRDGLHPLNRYGSVGFRCARTKN
jgi:formylglycine-generating enzyme required for sulfatase activity/3',5'-cyclic AMP phosphodiesterase CpdA